MANEEFLRMAKVQEKCGLSRAQIYRRIAAGTFPRPRNYRGSNKSVFWLSSEIANWQQEELAAC